MVKLLKLTEDAERTQTAGFRGLHMVSEGSTWVSTPSLHINGPCSAAYFSRDDAVRLKEPFYTMIRNNLLRFTKKNSRESSYLKAGAMKYLALLYKKLLQHLSKLLLISLLNGWIIISARFVV